MLRGVARVTWRVFRSAAVTLLLVELALWIAQPEVDYAYRPYWPHMSHFRRSDILPMELRPNGKFRFNMPEFDTTIGTNALGVRGGPVAFDRPRILCLGDSFTFGMGVEDDETWCAVLERLFGGKYRFVNAGFAAGYSPDTYAVWLRRYGPAVNPAGIIVQISEYEYGIVDEHAWFFSEAARARGDPVPLRITRPGFTVTEDGAWIRDSFAAHLPGVLRRLMKRSYIVAILRDRVVHDAEERPRPAVPPAPGAGGPDANAEKFTAALRMLRHEVGDRVVGIYMVRHREATTEGRGERLVRRFAREHGLRVFANHDEFEASDYFRLDPHWTAAGQAKVARFLHRQLVALDY